MAKAIQKRQAEISLILQGLLRGKNDDELIAELAIPRASYFRYKDSLREELISRFKRSRRSDVAQWSQILHLRLSRYLAVLDERLSEATDAKDVALLTPIMIQIAEKLFEFETQTLQRVEGIRSAIDLEESITDIQKNRKKYGDTIDDIEDEDDEEMTKEIAN